MEAQACSSNSVPKTVGDSGTEVNGESNSSELDCSSGNNPSSLLKDLDGIEGMKCLAPYQLGPHQIGYFSAMVSTVECNNAIQTILVIYGLQRQVSHLKKYI